MGLTLVRAALVMTALASEPALANPAAAGPISGRVLGPDGRGIPGAAVSVVDTDVRARTGADGHFEIAAEPPLELHVVAPGFTERTIEVRSLSGGPVVIPLAPQAVLSESLLVSAPGLGDRYSPSSVASAAFDPLDAAFTPTSVKEAVIRVAGVAENGQGGLFQTYSVRGVSRQRLLSLVDGMRVTSARRAGASTSFLDPLLIGEIDVLRGPASTYYGSGALGGAIQVLPRTFARVRAVLGYESNGDEAYQSVGWGDGTWSLGVARRAAGDGETARGERLFSRFDQTSATARRRLGGERLGGGVMVVASYGSDIGKANTGFPERRTLYPRERHLMLRAALEGRGVWRAALWGHPNDLVTDVMTLDGSRQEVVNDAFDLGALYERQLPLSDAASRRFDGRVGASWFGRRGVTASERSFAPGGVVGREQRTLDRAREDQSALFVLANARFDSVQLELGVRSEWLRQSNGGVAGRQSDRRSGRAGTGFGGIAWQATERLRLVANIGLGLRFPSLTERFFAGTTGRGQVLGNPTLRDESALSTEISLRRFGRHSYVGATLFRNRVHDYIDRIEIEPGLRTFVNVERGTIRGIELDGFVVLQRRSEAPRVRIDYSGHRIEARTDRGQPLSDAPADRLRLGVEIGSGPWRWASSLEYRFEKDDPGADEKVIPDAELASSSIERRLGSSRWAVVLEGENLLDQRYFPSADSDVPEAPGRTVGPAVRWTARR